MAVYIKCSRCKPTPRWMSSKWFRYGLLLFFLTMFGNMVFQNYLVAAGAASLREAITVLDLPCAVGLDLYSRYGR